MSAQNTLFNPPPEELELEAEAKAASVTDKLLEYHTARPNPYDPIPLEREMDLAGILFFALKAGMALRFNHHNPPYLSSGTFRFLRPSYAEGKTTVSAKIGKTWENIGYLEALK